MEQDYEQAIRLNTGKLTKFAMSLTKNEQEAEGLAQDAIYMALRHRSEYNSKWGIAAWLAAIAVNIKIYDLRRGRRMCG